MTALATMPASGRVIVAAQYAAFEFGLDYMLDPYFPAGAVFVVDIDRCWQLEHEWMTEHTTSTTWRVEGLMSELEIWKFPLPVIDMPVIEMPAGAKVLTVASQNDLLCAWAIVDPGASLETRWFCVRGTGHTLTGDEGAYVGTAMFQHGALVFHVFEAALPVEPH